MWKSLLGAVAIMGFMAGNSWAATINQSAFSGSENLIDFALAAPPPPGPFTIGDVRFTEASSGFGGAGWQLPLAGGLADNAGQTDITVDFIGSSFQRVGFDALFFGPTAPPALSTYAVSFFDTDLSVIDTVNVSLVGRGKSFVGYEHLPGIRRIRIEETSGDNFFIGGLDNLRFENVAAVPVPAALPLLATAFAGLGFVSWRRKRTSA